MELAQIMQNKIIIMFIMLLIGVMVYKAGVITKEADTQMNNVLLLLINPFVIFSSYQTDREDTLFLNLIISFGLAAASFAIEISVSYLLIRKKGNQTFATERISAIYSNCGFMGIPLIYSLFGKEGVFYLTAYITCFSILLWTQGVILMTGKRDIKIMVKNLYSPAMIATATGILCFLFQIRLPSVVLEPIETIGNMNTPFAMLIAGATLGKTNILSSLKHIRIYYISFIKLIIIPLVVALAFAWLPVSQTVKLIPLIATACPTGASGTMFALRYNQDSNYASHIFAVTTILSMFTMPLIVILAQKIYI